MYLMVEENAELKKILEVFVKEFQDHIIEMDLISCVEVKR